MTTAFQFDVLAVSRFNISSIIKTCGVCQINPKSKLFLFEIMKIEISDGKYADFYHKRLWLEQRTTIDVAFANN